MADLAELPRDYYSKLMAFTKMTYRDVYPSIDPTTPELSLAGKVAIVTGASRGIGKAIAQTFVQAGIAGLVLLATSASGRLEAVEAELKATNEGLRTLRVGCDIADAASVEAALARIRDVFGGDGGEKCSVLVNAAGVLKAGGQRIGDADPEAWWRNFEINGKGTFLVTRAFLRLVSPPGPSSEETTTTPPSPFTQPPTATIINLSSWQAFVTAPGNSGYWGSKFVVDNLTSYVAAEYPGQVNAVSLHPGLVATDMLIEPFRSAFDLDAPGLVAGVAAWLAADPGRAAFLSGRFLSANWDVEELVKRRGEIVQGGLLRLCVGGEFGKGA